MSGLKNNFAFLLRGNWHAWFLPAATFFFIPFESMLYVPLVIMSLTGLILFFNKGIYRVCWSNSKYRLLICVFASIWLPMLVSLTDAVNPDHSAKVTLLLLPYLFVGFFILFYLDSQEVRTKLCLAILFITSFWCIDALVQLLFDENLLGNTYLSSTRLSGIFYPKFTLGLVLAVLLPVILEQLKKIAINHAGLLIAIVIASIHVAVIILSGSRNSLIMLVVGIFGWFLYTLSINRNINWRRLILVIAISIPIVATLSLQQPSRHLTLVNVTGFNIKSLDKISNHRLPLWEATARMSLDHWINGIGPRGFRYAYGHYRPEKGKYHHEFKNASTHPHFALLEITAETGLIGLSGVFILLLLLYKQLNWLADTRKLDVYPWFLGAVIAIVPNIAKAFYSSSWMSIVLCMIFIGIANIANESEK